MSWDIKGLQEKRVERIHVVYQPKQRDKTKYVCKYCRETCCFVGTDGGAGDRHGHDMDTAGKCREWVTVKSHSPAPGRIR